MLCVFSIFSACKKDNNEDNVMTIIPDKPGEIPGLGETSGELTGEKFEFPEGIELEEEITGYAGSREPMAKSTSNTAIKASLEKSFLKAERAIGSLSTQKIISVGSGNFVRLALRLKNTTSAKKTIELPAGLIIKSRTGRYQHGVLLKKTSFTIDANESVLTDLYMYCGNVQKSSSSIAEKYDLSVISNSSSLHELIDLLKNKKINIEQYLGQENGFYDYSGHVGVIQNCLWSITDSKVGLTDSNYKDIEELPND